MKLDKERLIYFVSLEFLPLKKLEKFFTKFWLIITICCFILIGISLFAYAGENRIGLEWDTNTEKTLEGYNVKVSINQPGGPYTQIGTVYAPITEFWWYGILTGDDYYFVVTAFNNEGKESGNSNEICAYIDPDKDYAIECGTEYESEETNDGGSGGCFIETICFVFKSNI